MNIFEIIKSETALLGHRTAVVEGANRISYRTLIDAAELVAENLLCRGVERCHRIGLLCDDSIDYIIVSLAILSLHAVIVPVSPEQTDEERKAVITRIDVDFLLAEQRLYQGAEGMPLPSAGFRSRDFVIVRRSPKLKPPDDYYRVNPAFIRFSSGTTGTSKGVVLSHESIIERTDAADDGLRITPEDTVLWVLSMSYHFVVTILLFLRRGATIVLCGRPFPEALVTGIIRERGTFIYASPFHYGMLARSDALAADALGQVRMAVSTAMKLPLETAEQFRRKFGFQLTEAYGIIEVGLPFIRLDGEREKPGSVGRALPAYEVMLDQGDADGAGEILIRGKGMLDAYYSPWQGRNKVLTDGWFRTGDIGRFDRDGFLSIVGREKEVINFVGMKIFPQEVEEVLNRHPLVRESLVYGMPHPVYGELPVAKIVPASPSCGDSGLDELRRFCYHHLASYKVPKEFKLVDLLEKTASGKIQRYR